MKVIPRFRRRSEAERTGTMTLIEHLEELRSRLIICLYAVAVGSVAGWFLYEPFKRIAANPYCDWVMEPTAG